nr:protocadherin 11 [Hymenolepis microstoma]
MAFAVYLLLTVIFTTASHAIKKNEIVMNVSEGAEVGSTIGSLASSYSAGSRDTSYIGMLKADSLFNIETNGKVVVARPIDLESLCQERVICCSNSKPCQLSYTVMVEKSRFEDMAEIELRIRIMDANDHAPRFRKPNGQVVQISEKALTGTSISIEPAIDGDWSLENQIQRYALHGSDIQRYFDIDNSNLPRVELRLREQLDYEKQSIYKGTLEACDRHNCTTTPLTINVIDVNDNLPFFHAPLEYSLSLPEDTPSGKIILRLNATDNDSPPNARMRFEFDGSGDPSIPTTFHLDPFTGAISLARRLQADAQLNYRFKVRVTDVSDSAPEGTFNDLQRQNTVTVNVRVEDINDFAPDIQMVIPPEGSEVWVPENSPPAKIVTLKVDDRDLGDNGQVSCRLDSPDGSFELKPLVSSVYTLHSLRKFDAEVEPIIFVNVTCSDKGTPQPKTTQKLIVVRIEDENEFEPVFLKKEYTAKITENAPNNTFVLQVIARDEDQSAQLEYSLKGDDERYFNIDPGTGKITTMERDVYQMSRLDREMTPEITFFVYVRDARPERVTDEGKVDSQKSSRVVHTAQATVTVHLIDENDNAPSFTDIGPFYLLENQPKHSKANGHLHAEDPDDGLNGKVKYGLQDVWDSSTHLRKHSLFQLDETSGVLRALEPLDREQTSEYILRVVACDMAPRDTRCTRTNVTLSVGDVNDNAPEWLFPLVTDDATGDNSECVNITTDAVTGQVVAQLVAHDRDDGQNGKVRFGLHDPHSQVVFAVNSTTGQITVANRYYTGLTEASDSRSLQQPNLQPGVHRLRIRASDMGQPPQFSDTWLTIRVVGANSGFFTLQTGLLVLLVLVTLIIAVSLIAAIICIRRQHATGFKTRQQVITTPTHPPSYILPPNYPHSDYPTFLKQNGSGPAYMLAKTTAASVCSSEHCDGSGGGNCPVTDLGVNEFYAPYGLASSTQGDEQVRFVEVDPNCSTYLVGSNASPGLRIVGGYHPLAYNTCDSLSQLPTNASGSTHGMLKFRQTSGSPTFIYHGRGNGEEVFELPENSGGRYSAQSHPHTSSSSQHQHLASSEQFEGGSADSGRGVSEDEPPSSHVIHCNDSTDCLPLTNTSTFFCQNNGNLHTPSTFLGNSGLQEERLLSTGECLG